MDDQLRLLRARAALLAETEPADEVVQRKREEARRLLEDLIGKLDVPAEALEPAPQRAPFDRPRRFEFDSREAFVVLDDAGEVRFRFRVVSTSSMVGVESMPRATPASIDVSGFGHGPSPMFASTAALTGGLTASLSVELNVSIAECHGR